MTDPKHHTPIDNSAAPEPPQGPADHDTLTRDLMSALETEAVAAVTRIAERSGIGRRHAVNAVLRALRAL
jgi:hypothetical protein